MLFTIHTDGGARGNPGPAAVGIVIEQAGKILQEIGIPIGHTTNNVAEYTAVLKALETAVSMVPMGERGEIQFFLDSLLVVNQLRGIYKIKEPRLRELSLQVKRLEREWGSRVSYQHIPRSQNSHADQLVNQALDAHQ